MSFSRTAIESAPHAQPVLTRYLGVWLIGIAFVYYLTYFNYGVVLDDEGYLLLNAVSVLHGQWPMADFFSYEPLSYFGLGLFFKLLGNSVLTERIMLMGLILLNVWLIHYCAKRILPPSWAWIPAAIYAFAPGPWYKVFFISHLLLSLATLVYFLGRPGVIGALLLGLTTGLAAVSRIEAAAVIVILSAGFLAIYAGLHDDHQAAAAANVGLTRLAAFVRLETMFFLGSAAPIAIGAVAYGTAGKLPALLQHIARYYNEPNYISYVNATPGVSTVFSARELFVAPSFEMWAYATAMIVCLFNVGRYGLDIVRRVADSQRAFIGFAIAIFGVGSMGYTYFYVWNSRMLSSFAIVYICFFDLLFLVQHKLTVSAAGSRTAKAIVTLGILAMLFYLKSFIVVQNYSGSYTTYVRGAMATIDTPVLKGIHVYADQVDDIVNMLKLTDHAPKGSSLVSMSESTTMGYIAGLPNPTYYRLFFAEFAPPGERERAIQVFERYRITYFVARRSQFLQGGDASSNLNTYAPQIKAYLLEKYRIIPLGNRFVLLVRKISS